MAIARPTGAQTHATMTIPWASHGVRAVPMRYPIATEVLASIR